MLSVRCQGGVVVEYMGQGVIIDPSSTSVEYPVFVSHAHGDHSAAFRFPCTSSHATEETIRLIKALSGRCLQEPKRLTIGSKVRIGDVEVKTLNAGHILGSAQFEVDTPEGIVLYTGDFSLGDSYTMKPAEIVRCDLLIIETTFGSPIFSFPKREQLAIDMVKWATIEVISKGRIPVFKTDSIGNAQEIITIFNRLTRLPVVTVKGVTKASDVYREYGFNLEYFDSDSDEGVELLESGKCVLITSKWSKLAGENLEIALASGWASIIRGKTSRQFPLSDHADFRGLLGFIKSCKPKKVLTMHGGALTRGFADYVKARLGIDAKPLTIRGETLFRYASMNESRMKACCDQVLSTVRIPGFIYVKRWLLSEMAKKGFSYRETEDALSRIIERGIISVEGSEIKLNIEGLK